MKVHEQHKSRGPSSVNIALFIVSSSRYGEKLKKKPSSDKTRPLVKSILNEYSFITLKKSDFIPDSPERIENALNQVLNRKDKIDAIIFSGGTGLSPKDLTHETVQPRFEKELPGFGELFRRLSHEEIGTSAMLSRATCGIIKKKIIFLLPGSPNAVKLALKELIIPEIQHLVYIVSKKE